ncbi:inter-alpha-trypsin inhibitor heavy chain H3-like isoform X2 [Apostichopus japonicus]|uniref:inter-alpha-trypsin inhibitor heavy chain H3-like isoform X2 n=1 Tax=Stichopus japonicus TaxID=307972 RepID=UPI003AB3DAC9
MTWVLLSNELQEIYLGNPYIQSIDVQSDVSSGFADTVMTITIINDGGQDQVAEFNLLMPAEALIVNYTVDIYGPGKYFSREDASKIFDFEIPAQGVEARTFSVILTVPAESAGIVRLNYQELLRRMNGEYILRVYLDPGQLAENVQVEVNVDDHRELTFIESLWESADLDSLFKERPTTTSQGSSSKSVRFEASARQQRRESLEGLNGYVTVAYDVEQGSPDGSITVDDRFFLHRISPQELIPLKKRTIYLVDSSTSMEGIKLDQLKLALEETINLHQRGESFNIVTFSDIVTAWKDTPTKATQKNKESAIDYVKGITTSGENDLLEAIKLILPMLETTDGSIPTIVLFTNGPSSDGISDVVDVITKTIDNRYVLHVIGIGAELVDNDYHYRKLAGNNNGEYRLIVPNSQSYQDIVSFLRTYSTTLMWNVGASYPSSIVDMESLTKHFYLSYYDGQDIVIAGRLNDDFTGDTITSVVSGDIQGGPFELELSTPIRRVERAVTDFAERAYKFLTLSDKMELTNLQTTDERNQGLNEVVEMAETFKFVLDQKALPPQAIGGRGDTAAGDPHIVIRDPNSDMKICFDIHGPEGLVVNLVEDPVLGITVNGEMVEKFNYTSVGIKKQTPSFFGRIFIRLGDDSITVSRDSIVINEELPLKWYRNPAVQVGTCKVMVNNRKVVKVSCPDGVEMKVYRHPIHNGFSDHFDFYLGKGGMFSTSVNGIIGQFQRRQITLDTSSIRVTKHGREKALLLLDGEEITVSKVSRRRTGTCWANYVRQGLQMLEMSYEQYILPNLYSKPNFS